MRRVISLFLALLLLLSTVMMLSSCGTPPNTGENPPDGQSGPSQPDVGDPDQNGGDGTPDTPDTPASPSALKIIYDTDMDCDCDDVGALALVLEYVKAEKAELLGVVTDVPSLYAAPACEAICREYGVNVPIGTIYNHEYPSSATERYKNYRGTQRDNINAGKDYNRTLAAMVGKTDVDYPSSARVYRELLAAAEDKSVTVVVVGMLTAIDALFLTTGDEISPLSGLELFEKKVIRVVSMGQMKHERSPKARSFNYINDREGAVNVFEKCPVPILISGAGGDIAVGKTYTASMHADHPVRVAYEIYCKGENKGRASWDLITMLYALDPDESIFSVLPCGTITYDNTNNWAAYDTNGQRGDGIVVLDITKAEMAELLEKQTKGIFEGGGS